MAYIVPSELPQTCHECAFCGCKFSYPFWATNRGEECGKQGYYCILDTQTPRRVMVVDFGDKTKKMEWCPLKKLVLCGECAVPHNKWTGCPNLNGLIPPPDFYCAYGERRNE